jgi:hypothetical protein
LRTAREQPEFSEEFFINEWVLMKYPRGPPTKLHPRRQGPFKIVEKRHRTYTVEDIMSQQRYKVDVDRRTKFRVEDNSLEQIERLLAKDRQEYIVEEILNHQNHPEHGWQFLVKWKEYTASENTWEPVKINDNLGDYYSFSLYYSIF